MIKLLLVTLFSIAIAACGGGSSTGSAASTSISATATTTAQNLTVGTAMTSFSPLTPSGGATPYTYSYSGTLPTGLSFSTSTGAVTGTPTAAYATASLVFSVKDANNVVASTTSTVSFTVSSTVIQPGSLAGKDTAFGTVYATNGIPDAADLYIGGWGDTYYDFFEFDLTGSPQSAAVTKVELWLYGHAPNDPGLQIYTISQPWTEVGVTLANNPASTFYKNMPPVPSVGGWIVTDITGLYKGWKDGLYPNYGIKLVPTSNANTNGSISSSDNLDPTIRPKLVITTSGSTGSAISATATTTAQNLTVGTVMTSFTPLTASGGATPYTYSHTGTLPTGLSFNASTGAVTGTPTAAYATANLVFSVKDALNVVASTTSTVSFTVSSTVLITAVAAGGSHSHARKSDGTVWSWGLNDSGQLGDGGTTNRSLVQVSGLTGATATAAGYLHTLALKNDGTVWAWGANGSGQLGNGTTTSSSTPVQVSGLTGVTAISAGYTYSLALKSDGTVWAWGENGNGQLGDGNPIAYSTNYSTAPIQVVGLTGVTAIAGGYLHSLALKGDGTVWAWGHSPLGNGGVDSSTPVQASVLTGITAIATGGGAGSGDYSLALKGDGTLWAWGSNWTGQLGDGSITDRPTAVQVSGLTGVSAIVAGDRHSLALKSDGTVWAWGSNNSGRLGDGTTTDSHVPILVSGLTGITAIAAGEFHSLAIKGNVTVWAWGSNSLRQLGDGTTTDRYFPVHASGL
jgi:alpha-tubulin suppressor-like RCC1 family protein